VYEENVTAVEAYVSISASAEIRRKQQEASNSGLERCDQYPWTADHAAGGRRKTGVHKGGYEKNGNEAIAVKDPKGKY
jgi:hypothetical protein